MADLNRPAPPTGQIVWLASYPKSGNTWLRSLITAYLKPLGQTLDINTLSAQGAATRAALDDLLGLATGDLTRAELRNLLHRAYRAWSRRQDGLLYLKTHDAYDISPRGEPIFAQAATRCVIHLVREPRDVAVSAMHHWGLSLDATITRMNNPGQWVAEDADGGPWVPQKLSDWSGHASSWMNCPLPTLTLRYEDMLENPKLQFERVLNFVGLDIDAGRLAQAVDDCGFGRLQAQERDRGFVERRRTSTAQFFRSGKAGGWRQTLTTDQSAAILAVHSDMMRRFGYPE